MYVYTYIHYTPQIYDNIRANFPRFHNRIDTGSTGYKIKKNLPEGSLSCVLFRKGEGGSLSMLLPVPLPLNIYIFSPCLHLAAVFTQQSMQKLSASHRFLQ